MEVFKSGYHDLGHKGQGQEDTSWHHRCQHDRQSDPEARVLDVLHFLLQLVKSLGKHIVRDSDTGVKHFFLAV